MEAIGKQGAVLDFISHPVFKDAITDIESLGVKVTLEPLAGSIPYTVLGGRSNARWWLIPLGHHRVTASGLALFQPILTSARIMKAAAVRLSRFGLSNVWARPKIYISGTPSIGRHFVTTSMNFAYFTGTNSPHRKVAVQIMDDGGQIKGFAKVTRNNCVRKLLEHEAAILDHLRGLNLQSGYVPHVLFSGNEGGTTLLVTDTLKTPQIRTTTRLLSQHQAFLQELAQKTTCTVFVSELGARFRTCLGQVQIRLDSYWHRRLDYAIKVLELQQTLKLNVGLSHGDFTPWNTFLVDGKLYVFDWEYAEETYPSCNDSVHFLLNEPKVRNKTSAEKIEIAISHLNSPSGLGADAAPYLLLIYLLTQNLRQIERFPTHTKTKATWDGAEDGAEMIDSLLMMLKANSA